MGKKMKRNSKLEVELLRESLWDEEITGTRRIAYLTGIRSILKKRTDLTRPTRNHYLNLINKRIEYLEAK